VVCFTTFMSLCQTLQRLSCVYELAYVMAMRETVAFSKMNN